MSANQTVPIYKLLVTGDASVGKSSVVSVWNTGAMPAVAMASFGAESMMKEVIFENDQKVKAKIVDTAGTEKYKSTPHSMYKGASGVMLMYDVTKGDSLPGCKDWLDSVREKAGQEIVVLLVGNKIDIVDADASARKVSEADVKAFMEANHIAMHMETSAMEPRNVPESFRALLRQVCEVNNVRTSVAPTDPETEPDPPPALGVISADLELGKTTTAMRTSGVVPAALLLGVALLLWGLSKRIPPTVCTDVNCCKFKAASDEALGRQVCENFYSTKYGVAVSMLTVDVWKDMFLAKTKEDAGFYEKAPANYDRKDMIQFSTITHRNNKTAGPFSASNLGIVYSRAPGSVLWNYTDGFACTAGRAMVGEMSLADYAEAIKNNILELTRSPACKNRVKHEYNDFELAGLPAQGIAGILVQEVAGGPAGAEVEQPSPSDEHTVCAVLRKAEPTRTAPWPVYSYVALGNSSSLRVERHLHCPKFVKFFLSDGLQLLSDYLPRLRVLVPF